MNMSYEDLRTQLQQVADDTLKIAKDMNITTAEAFVYSNSVMKITENKGKYENRTGKVQGIGIRTAIGKKVGFASCSGFSKASIKNALHQAYLISQKSPENPLFPGFTSSNSRGLEGILDNDIIAITPSDLIDQIQEMLSGIDTKDEKITSLQLENEIEWGGYVIATTEGCNQSSLRSIHTAVADTTLHQEGIRKSHFEYKIGRKIQEVSNIAIQALENANRGLNSIDFKGTKKLPLIMHPDTASNVLGTAMPQLLAGDLFVEDRSPLKDKLDEKIANTTFTLTDNGQNPESPRTCAIDGEGTQVGTTPLITNGIFNTFLFDRKYGLAAEKNTTGNAFRGSNLPYQNSVMIAPHKLVVQPQSKSLDEIIASYDEAILMEMIPTGMHTANMFNGDFSLTSNNCYLIKNGSISHALNNLSLSGNFFELLENIEYLGKDLKKSAFSLDAPTVAIKDVTFSG